MRDLDINKNPSTGLARMFETMSSWEVMSLPRPQVHLATNGVRLLQGRRLRDIAVRISAH